MLYLWKTGVAGGAALFGWALVFYVSHAALVATSVLPSVVRTYQIYKGDTPLALEIVVELARVALVLLMIHTANRSHGSLLAAETWRSIWPALAARTGAMTKDDWLAAILQYAMLMLILWGLNKGIEALLTESRVEAGLQLLSWRGLNVSSAAAASVFFLKNILVIPVTLASVLRLIRWV